MFFDSTIHRIGFCCKFVSDQIHTTAKEKKLFESTYNTRGTTVAWCNRQERNAAEQRLLEIVQHNMSSAKKLVEYTGSLAPNLRMVRLSSDLIPLATHPDWKYLWLDTDHQKMLEKGFAEIGDTARKLDVRISFHPGQFCVLASDKPGVVERSIEEFEYHALMAAWMGFGRKFMDMKINVHISGRLGSQGIIDVLPKLSDYARNTLTIENDEMCWGLNESLKLKDHVALVLDIHHHWIRDEEYIQPDDDRVHQVLESWRGVRPALHYSYSRCNHLGDSDNIHSGMHCIRSLLREGAKKQKLRAHSDMYPNREVNDWALSFWDNFDIQCEAKSKNLAAQQLFAQSQNNRYN